MMKKKGKRWTRSKLLAFGIPAVLIPGLLTVLVLGWNPSKLMKTQNYYANQTLFPKSGVVAEVYDGDTFRLQNNVEVRLLGVNAPNRGAPKWQESQETLDRLIVKKQVYLEYDRYQDDKYGRILAWVWMDCEDTPTFLPPDYMHLTYNSSREGLKENPAGCKKGKLVNEEMVKNKMAP